MCRLCSLRYRKDRHRESRADDGEFSTSSKPFGERPCGGSASSRACSKGRAYDGTSWLRARDLQSLRATCSIWLAGDLKRRTPPHSPVFLERLGSRLVFLIDWSRARKRLRLLVPNERAVEILR
jgi:hypothetical protein